MSRAKAKLALIHDFQSKQCDVILTKKDCDMIAEALKETYAWPQIRQMYYWYKNLSKL